MNQIPNIEETNDFPELEKQYVAMWDKGEFEWNHHDGDELGKKPISPWRIWTTFIKPTLHQQLQKAREEERERIYTAVDDVASVVLVAEIKTGDKDEILGMLRSITL